MQRSVLVVDDERNMRMVMELALSDAGYRVITAECAEDALPLIHDPDLDVILSDLKMPGMPGDEFIRQSRQLRPDVPVIVVTAFGSIRSAIKCIQAGASNYLTKPFEPEELQFSVENAIRYRDLMLENQRWHAMAMNDRRNKRLLGDGPAMQNLRAQIQQVAPFKTNILITGESGTGKEAVARTIHEQGPRADNAWVALNCSAIPHDLMESELFGYVKGAFTGALQNRLGRLEQANHGTLFLDEIGDLNLELQAKLLRVLQEREFSPVGSDAIRRVDVRIITATNRDLHELVRLNLFREDLLYRLDVYNIHVPPLRARAEDIPMLANLFLTEFRSDMGKSVVGISEDAIAAMSNYTWPGNVRELRNAIERSLLTCTGDIIEKEDLPDKVYASQKKSAGSVDGFPDIGDSGLDEWLQETEKKIIVQALEDCDGVQANAARQLGITERSLWHRLKKYNIQVNRKVAD
jgi:two-component system, NtrC family, response regulator AtoC